MRYDRFCPGPINEMTRRKTQNTQSSSAITALRSSVQKDVEFYINKMKSKIQNQINVLETQQNHKKKNEILKLNEKISKLDAEHVCIELKKQLIDINQKLSSITHLKPNNDYDVSKKNRFTRT